MAMLKAPLTPGDHRRGDPDAPIVLVEYGDYQCPHCAAAEPVVEALLRAFGQDLQGVFRHFPLSQVHPLSEVSAQAAEFAGAHGAYWPCTARSSPTRPSSACQQSSPSPAR